MKNKHSFKQLKKFYETVKNSIPIDIEKSAEVMTNRQQLLDDTYKLKGKFDDIISKKNYLEKVKQDIKDKKNQISEKQKALKGLTKDWNNLNPDENNKRIKEAEALRGKEIKEMEN